MKNRINSLSLSAINRSLAAVGESVDRESFARPVAQPIFCDEAAAVNRSLARLGESVDNAFFEPEADVLAIGAHNNGRGLIDLSGLSVYAGLARHDHFADLQGLGEGCADMLRAAINRSVARFGDVELAAEDFEPVVEYDEVSAFNRSLALHGEAI